jgi:GAF domain
MTTRSVSLVRDLVEAFSVDGLQGVVDTYRSSCFDSGQVESDVRLELIYPNKDQNYFEQLAAAGFDPSVERDVQLLIDDEGGQGIVARALSSKEAILVKDCSKASGFAPATVNPDEDDTACELVVPCMLGQDVVVLLNVESPRKEALDEEAKTQAESLAPLLALMVDYEAHESGKQFVRDTLKELAGCKNRQQILGVALKAVMDFMGAEYGGAFEPPHPKANVQRLRLLVNEGLNMLEMGEAYDVEARFGAIKDALASPTNDCYRSEAKRDIQRAKALVRGVVLKSNYAYVLRVDGLVFAVVNVESSSKPALPERRRAACRELLDNVGALLVARIRGEEQEDHDTKTNNMEDLAQECHDYVLETIRSMDVTVAQPGDHRQITDLKQALDAAHMELIGISNKIRSLND